VLLFVRAVFAVANDWGMKFTFPKGKVLNGNRVFMKPSVALDSNRMMIRQVVESHHARNARGFGSVRRGQDTDSSDLDILVAPMPETTLLEPVCDLSDRQDNRLGPAGANL
jgi:predicted nucleotidyltransferase